MKNMLILFIALIQALKGNSQSKDSAICVTQKVDVYPYVEGYSYQPKLIVKRSAIREGFTLALSDKSYKVVGFKVFYEFDHCPMDSETIIGSTADRKNLRILNGLNKYGEGYFEFICITVEKKGQRYKVPNFFILLED